ncbi:histidinol phosphate aminotransferase [Epibacterium sp. SM1979]|uniref:Histidinol phosphate aminotransferase n=1 Tax=Tritonibacter litoralis TaxID=2662264 RepID=A0A843YFL1_9RHOB|nr:histidinol phosphate aminotransferase [Tritonibacter litoralis]MQQ07889.1 histidinol phosphate aminotransferase [Tritonibacter litoralis]
MQRREDQPDYQSALFIFLGVSLIWLFLIVWGLFGMGPVLVLAVVLNHLITRLGVVLEDYSVTEDRF